MPIDWTPEAIEAACKEFIHGDAIIEIAMRAALDAAVKVQGWEDDLDAFLSGQIAGQREGWNDAIEAAAKLFGKDDLWESEECAPAIRALSKSGE